MLLILAKLNISRLIFSFDLATSPKIYLRLLKLFFFLKKISKRFKVKKKKLLSCLTNYFWLTKNVKQFFPQKKSYNAQNRRYQLIIYSSVEKSS